MKRFIPVILWGILSISMGACGLKVNQTEVLAEIVQTENGFQLLYKGEPYFVQGTVGSHRFDLMKKYGANSVRTGRLSHEKLEMLDSIGLTVLFGLPVRAERDGMDYDSAGLVKEQFDRVMERVLEFKDHPAILFWQLGNELDYVDPETPPNWKVYDAVNEMAREIHRIDPARPVLTVLGTGKKWKLEEFISRCPDIDLVGINAYGDITEIPSWLNKFGFNKPFVVTEWGPTGHWQVPRTEQGVPLEENSTQKADAYKEHYETAILGNPGLCLGSYVFLWRQHQERTHTWYGMFDEEWRESAAVDVMRAFWTGKQPDNQAPVIHEFTLDQKTGLDNITFMEDAVHEAVIDVSDPDGDPLSYQWEILPENLEFGYGGHGEKKPGPVDCILTDTNIPHVEFKTPEGGRNYRIFIEIYDGNGNHFAYANIPFFVEPIP